jgi:hypothetical protein
MYAATHSTASTTTGMMVLTEAAVFGGWAVACHRRSISP